MKMILFDNIFGINGNIFAIIISLLAFILLIGLCIYSSFLIVNSDEIAIIERFGKYHKTLKRGVHFLIPIFERVVGLDKTGEHDFTYKIKNNDSLLSIKIVYEVLNHGVYFYKEENLKNCIEALIFSKKNLLNIGSNEDFLVTIKREITTNESMDCIKLVNILINEE